jgi:hypothetical protein
MMSIGVIVFGAALSIPGGTVLSEYEAVMVSAGTAPASPQRADDDRLRDIPNWRQWSDAEDAPLQGLGWVLIVTPAIRAPAILE